MPAHPARHRLVSGSCPSAHGFAPRFLPTIGHPHAVALHFVRCGQLTEDFHLQNRAHAGRTQKKRPVGRLLLRRCLSGAHASQSLPIFESMTFRSSMSCFNLRRSGTRRRSRVIQSPRESVNGNSTGNPERRRPRCLTTNFTIDLPALFPNSLQVPVNFWLLPVVIISIDLFWKNTTPASVTSPNTDTYVNILT